MSELAAPITRERFLAQFKEERAAWEAQLEEIPAERWTEPGASGDWTVKDVVAHVVWHDREIIGVLRARALVGSELWALDTPSRNEAIYAESRDRSLAEVQADARQTGAELEAEVERLTEEDLNEPARIRDMLPGYRPWQLLADNTYDHYRDHRSVLRAWLEETKGGG